MFLSQRRRRGLRDLALCIPVSANPGSLKPSYSQSTPLCIPSLGEAGILEKMLCGCRVGHRGRLFLVFLQHVHYRAVVSCWKYLVGRVKNEMTYLGLTEAEAKRGKTQPRESGQGLYFLVGQFHVKFRVTRPERAYL